MPGTRLDPAAMARRAAQELFSGAVVALGPGLPCQLPGEIPDNGVWFLADSGVLGNNGLEANSLVRRQFYRSGRCIRDSPGRPYRYRGPATVPGSRQWRFRPLDQRSHWRFDGPRLSSRHGLRRRESGGADASSVPAWPVEHRRDVQPARGWSRPS